MDRQAFIAWNRRKQMRFREQNELLIAEQLAAQEAQQQTIDNPVIEQLLILDGDGSVTTSGVGAGGTPSPGPEVWTDEYSFFFDGSAGTEVIVTDEDDEFDFTETVTCSAWVKPTILDHAGGIIDKFNASGDDSGFCLWQSSSDDGKWRGTFGIREGGATSQQLNVEIDVPSTDWQHVATTYNAATGLAVLYHNGASAASVATLPSSPMVLNNADLVIAARSPGGGSDFGGFLDELAVYATALTAVQIAAIYNQGGAGKPGDLSLLPSYASIRGWWRMGEDAIFSNPGGAGEWTIPNVANPGVNDGLGDGVLESWRRTDVP